MIGNYIKATSGGGGGSLSTAKLMKTGQTTSYRTGDDGDIEAGRDVDFFTLAENNPFGTTDRFTDELGTQVYANDIVIDWSTYDGSTVLGWRKTLSAGNWNTAIDNSLLVSIGSFTSGWKLPNITELQNIINYELPLNFSYIPFNFPIANLWSSNTPFGATADALITYERGQIIRSAKTSGRNYIPCRYFTVTGTTLS